MDNDSLFVSSLIIWERKKKFYQLNLDFKAVLHRSKPFDLSFAFKLRVLSWQCFTHWVQLAAP